MYSLTYIWTQNALFWNNKITGIKKITNIIYNTILVKCFLFYSLSPYLLYTCNKIKINEYNVFYFVKIIFFYIYKV